MHDALDAIVETIHDRVTGEELARRAIAIVQAEGQDGLDRWAETLTGEEQRRLSDWLSETWTQMSVAVAGALNER